MTTTLIFFVRLSIDIKQTRKKKEEKRQETKREKKKVATIHANPLMKRQQTGDASRKEKQNKERTLHLMLAVQASATVVVCVCAYVPAQ